MPDILIYFGLGVLFIESIPVLDAFLSLLVQFFSMLQSFLAVVITKQSAKIANIKKETSKLEPDMVRQIGFAITDDEENYDEESEDY